MNSIDLTQVRRLRILWTEKARMWRKEAARRAAAAKAGANKDHAIHMKMSREAEEEAERYEKKLAELDSLTQEGVRGLETNQ